MTGQAGLARSRAHHEGQRLAAELEGCSRQVARESSSLRRRSLAGNPIVAAPGTCEHAEHAPAPERG